MGEMAGYYVNRMLDDPFEGNYQPRTVECKHCGKGGLFWEDDNGKWVLLEHNGKVHKCDETKLHKQTADDFEVLDE